MADDPRIPEFESEYSYGRFARRVRQSDRYGFNPDDRAFLKTVAATISDMDQIIPQGFKLFRAQHGIATHTQRVEDIDEEFELPIGLPRDRMKPLKYSATSGRANPVGVPVLYLASQIETAISEIRPWIGSPVTVAKFEVNKDIRAIDLTRAGGRSPTINPLKYLDAKFAPTAEQKANHVWGEMNRAFSTPVTETEKESGYAPTQMLAELFKWEGYHAVIYKSNFGGEHGYNIVLFDLESADFLSSHPYSVSDVTIKFNRMETYC